MGNWQDFFKYYSSGNSNSGVKNFSVIHLGWLVVAIIATSVCITTYKKLSIKNKQAIMKFSALSLIIIYMQRSLWAASSGHFKVDSMLPFHLCGAMVFVEFYAVFTNSKLMKEFVYCAGLPGASVALITPELNGYPLFSFQYQAFILSHLVLVLIPLFWVFGDDFKPDRKYMVKAYVILCIMALVDGFINRILHSNYMFVSKAPVNTPFYLIEKQFGHIGYIAFLLIAVYLIMSLMYLPWQNKPKNELL
jgi:hypothetical integral membrane protein (TIGR02206 family)